MSIANSLSGKNASKPEGEVKGSLFGRFVAFFYGVAAYALFFVVFLYAIGFVADLGVAKTIDSGVAGPAMLAVVIDLVLMTVFALQHSIMARPKFKAWWTQYVPKAIERSTYVLLASLALALLIWQWRPLPAVIWHIDNPAVAMAVTGLSFFGYLFLLISSSLINHFELFGLQQVTNNLTGSEMPTHRFRTPLFYRLVRHPIYLGFMIAFWATPTMTVGHLLFAGVITAYILIGIQLEERDLIDLFGDEYRRYKSRVAMVVPWRKPG